MAIRANQIARFKRHVICLAPSCDNPIWYRNCGTIGSQGTIHTEKEDYEPLSNQKWYFSPENGNFLLKIVHFKSKIVFFHRNKSLLTKQMVIFDQKLISLDRVRSISIQNWSFLAKSWPFSTEDSSFLGLKYHFWVKKADLRGSRASETN